MQESVVKKHNGVLFYHREQWNNVTWERINTTGDHHAKWIKSDTEGELSCFINVEFLEVL